MEKKSKKKVDRENVNTDKHDVTSELTGKEKMEREKVIDNLLERTRTLLDDCEKKVDILILCHIKFILKLFTFGKKRIENTGTN